MIELPYDASQLNYIIVSLDDADRPAIRDHLLKLKHEDRYLRFFATLGDSMIEKYALEVIDLHSGRAFGIITIPGRKLVGLAHVGQTSVNPPRVSAEVGFSIDEEYRGAGLSKRLMDRVVTYCQSHGINTLFMSCLRENQRMQKVARSFNLKIVTDAGEAIAELHLDPDQAKDAMPREIAYEQISIFDKAYRDNQALLNSVLTHR